MPNYTLNEPEKIEEVKRITLIESEPIYWKIEDSLYSGNLKLARSLHEMLLYSAKYNRKIIEALRPRYRERLKEITYELYSGKTLATRLPIEIRPNIKSCPIAFAKESELRDYLAAHMDLITAALGEQVRLVGTEVETDFEYRCDIVAENAKKFYPIELKIVQGKHQVVSQIEKYCFYFYRTLRYNHYRDIQGVVFASGFDDYSINELRKRGFWIFNVVSTPEEKIILRKIE